MADIDWTRPARRDLKTLSKRDAGRIKRAVGRLAESKRGDIKRLHGVSPSTHRLRVGSWRVMTQLKQDAIRIMRVLHRREAYKRSYWARQEAPEQGDLRRGECAEVFGEDGE